MNSVENENRIAKDRNVFLPAEESAAHARNANVCKKSYFQRPFSAARHAKHDKGGDDRLLSRFFSARVEKAQGHRGAIESQWTQSHCTCTPRTIHRALLPKLPFVCHCHTLPCRHIDRSAPTKPNHPLPTPRDASVALYPAPATLPRLFAVPFASTPFGHSPIQLFFSSAPLFSPHCCEISWKNRHASPRNPLFPSLSPHSGVNCFADFYLILHGWEWF